MKIFFPISGLKEYSCGYRGYRYSKIKEAIDFFGNNFIQLKGLGFTCTLEKLVKLKLIGAKFAEIPFIHRYDQKQSDSKMVSSITTLGYLIMTVLYHWPWGGWKTEAKKNKVI
jgi:dolichol-phosphate mannosyltransferase